MDWNASISIWFDLYDELFSSNIMCCCLCYHLNKKQWLCLSNTNNIICMHPQYTFQMNFFLFQLLAANMQSVMIKITNLIQILFQTIANVLLMISNNKNDKCILLKMLNSGSDVLHSSPKRHISICTWHWRWFFSFIYDVVLILLTQTFLQQIIKL